MEPRTEQTGNLNQQPVTTHGLLDTLQAITRRSRMVFINTIAMAAISGTVCLLLPNIYTAKAMILPSQEDKGLMTALMAQLGGLTNFAGAVGGTTTSDLYVSILRSDAVKEPIIERFRLMEVYKNKYRTDTSNDLDKNTAFAVGKKDGIITVAVDDKSPKRAAEMANAYVEELGKLAVRLNAAGAGHNRSFMAERLAESKGKLEQAEENLKLFQSRNKAVQMSAQAEATIKGVADMKAQLALQEVQLATARRQFTESSQEVKTLRTSISNIKAQIAKLEGMGSNSSIPSVGSMPIIGQEHVRLMREFKTQETLVELLTRQYEMARLSEAKDDAPFQVIQKAREPERKSKPHRSLIVFVATFAAFICSIYIAFVLENIEKMPDQHKDGWRMTARQLFFWKKQ